MDIKCWYCVITLLSIGISIIIMTYNEIKLDVLAHWTDTFKFKNFKFKLNKLNTTRSYGYEKDKNTTITGQPFPSLDFCSSRTPSYFVDMEQADLNNFTVITAASSNHFVESKDLIASVQEKFPDKLVHYYDIGLSKSQLQEIKSWCNVKYRKFHLENFPSHIRHLFTCAFKPLIIYEVLHEFDAVLWLDTSGRIMKNISMWENVFRTAKTTDGVVQFDRTGRDIFQCTTAGMYKYLPGEIDRLKKHEMIGAGIVLLYRTESFYKKILRWWCLCAFTEDCIEPKGHKADCGPRSVPGVSICHRYDQSALNILVANMLNYKVKQVPDGENFISVHRRATNFYKLNTKCGKGQNSEIGPY